MTQKGRIKSLLQQARWNYYARIETVGAEPSVDEMIGEMADELIDGGMTVGLSAKWIKDEAHSTKHKARYVCSNCLHYQTQSEYESEKGKMMYMLYYPYCGARMKGGEAG